MIKFIAFFDRNYNRLFHRKKLVKIEIHGGSFFLYNDIVLDGENSYRYLGKDLYKKLK